MQNIWNWLEMFFFSHFENQSVLRRQQWNREALQRLIFRIPSSRFFVFLASSLLFRVPDHLLNSFELLLITPPDSFVFLAAPSLSLFNSSKKQRAQVKANSHWINMTFKTMQGIRIIVMDSSMFPVGIKFLCKWNLYLSSFRFALNIESDVFSISIIL